MSDPGTRKVSEQVTFREELEGSRKRAFWKVAEYWVEGRARPSALGGGEAGGRGFEEQKRGQEGGSPRGEEVMARGQVTNESDTLRL